MQVAVLADGAFGEWKLVASLSDELGFGDVIRIQGNIRLGDAQGIRHPARAWVGKSGRAKTLRGARVNAERHEVPIVV